jgi:hypothetical protein
MFIPKGAAATARAAHWCNVQLSKEEAIKILEGGGRHARLDDIGQEHLTRSGAKLYPRGGGWYRLSGYHYSGQDICDDLVALQNPAKTAFASAHIMKYALKRRLTVLAGPYPDRARFPEWDLYPQRGANEWCKSCRHHINHESFEQWLVKQGDAQ